MSHGRALTQLRNAVSAMQATEEAFEPGDGAPDESERARFAQALYLIRTETRLLERRYGVNASLTPPREAVDWQTRQEQARELLGEVLGIAMNFRPGTEQGPGVGASRRALDLIRQALREYQRAQMEVIAS